MPQEQKKPLEVRWIRNGELHGFWSSKSSEAMDILKMVLADQKNTNIKSFFTGKEIASYRTDGTPDEPELLRYLEI